MLPLGYRIVHVAIIGKNMDKVQKRIVIYGKDKDREHER